MSTVERIQAILDCAVLIPEKDAAGVMIPAGVDNKIKVETLKQCLKIAIEEEKTNGPT